MQCKCIEESKQRIIEKQPFEGLKIEAVEFEMGFVFIKNEIISCTYTPIECKVEGKKRPIKKQVLHTFCPFCGVRIIPVEDRKEIES